MEGEGAAGVSELMADVVDEMACMTRVLLAFKPPAVIGRVLTLTVSNVPIALLRSSSASLSQLLAMLEVLPAVG